MAGESPCSIFRQGAEVAHRLAQREVGAAVHREREDLGLGCEEGRGAVALVHLCVGRCVSAHKVRVSRCSASLDVEVDDRDAARRALAAAPRGGDGEVVEYREARAEVPVSVVRAASQVRRHSVLQGKLRRQNRASAFEARALD